MPVAEGFSPSPVEPAMTHTDSFDLQRFVAAQAPVYDRVLDELRAGRKRTHWMWFIFPQIEGLGFSATSRRYAIRSRAEAAAYLQHSLLGARLAECAALLLGVQGRSALDILGAPDDLKLCSSMTLFAAVSPPGSVFARVLMHYFQGQGDPRTLSRLE